METTRELTVKVPAKLLEKLERLADQAHQRPETFIESALAHLTLSMSPSRRRRNPPAADGGQFEEAGMDLAEGYL